MTAWQSLHNIFAKAGVAPSTYVMDNEISEELLKALVKNKNNFQLVPPHTHRQNLAGQAIQTFKNHYKVSLASINPNVPLSE